jgi:hypothetical protein
VAVKRSPFWDVEPCTLAKAQVSEERKAFIFKVKDESKQETNMKKAASRAITECIEEMFPRNVR